MLPDDAFIRRLPRALDLAQRLAIDGLLTSADMADFAYERLVEELRNISSRSAVNINLSERLSLALHTWSIVDNLHNFCAFLHKSILSPDDGRIISDTLSVFSLLRNKHDHRPQNVPNLSKVKGSVDPVYGTILFYHPSKIPGNAQIELIPLGSMHHFSHHSPIIDRTIRPIQGDISNVTLSAFEFQVNISEKIAILRAHMPAINAAIEIVVRDAFAKGDGDLEPRVEHIPSIVVTTSILEETGTQTETAPTLP